MTRRETVIQDALSENGKHLPDWRCPYCAYQLSVHREAGGVARTMINEHSNDMPLLELCRVLFTRRRCPICTHPLDPRFVDPTTEASP